MSRPHGGWPAVQELLAGDHAPADEYLACLERKWRACKEASDAHDLVTWPDAPLRYVPFPAHTRDAAPHLYYLHYRSPAPFDRLRDLRVRGPADRRPAGRGGRDQAARR